MELKRTRVFIYILAFFVILSFSAITSDVSAASTTSKTVKSQKQLDKELKNSQVKKITIKTSAKKTFRIGKKKYKSKKIVLNAKKATLHSDGTVKSITVTAGKKLVQRGAANRVMTNAEGLDVVFEPGSDTDSLTVCGNDTTIDFNENSDVDTVQVEGEDAQVHIDEGSDVEQVSITGDNARIQDEESTNIEAEESVVAVIDGSSTDSTVELSDDGIYSSVVNRTDESLELEVEEEKTELSPGEVYSMTDSPVDLPSPLSDDNPFKKFNGMVKYGNICLEIHGCGTFSNMSTNERVHGWYHNISTGSDYECFFIIDGSRVTAERTENINFEKNYLGDAEFTIASQDDDSLTLVSENNVYGDKGTEYSLIFSDCNYQSGPGQEPVSVDNPLRIFSGGTNTDNGVWLEIHGTGMFANMSYANKFHGWYHNTNTGTDYECRFIVDGNSIAVNRIENTGYEQGFKGEASFEIVSANSNSIVLRSTNNVYGDEGTEYTFETYGNGPVDPQDPGSGDVNPNNPFVIFSCRVEGGNGLNLEIHGNGSDASCSSGDHIHGWYHNTNTGTDYECWFNVSGTSVVACRTENKTYERNYLGDATFEITASDSTSVTLKSTNDIYGDIGTIYYFSAVE